MLPRSVSEAVGNYFRLLSSEDVVFVSGIYLLGSIALGDYQEGRSDIDFAALLDGPMGEDRGDRLARVHRAMTNRGGPSFDGFYLEPHRLRDVPTTMELATFSLSGSFHRESPCFECNAVTWALWSGHGMALLGPQPRDLGIAHDEATLRNFQIGNLGGYWRGWIANATSVLSRKPKEHRVDAGTIAWGILGVARIACTLATGRVVSKSEAGQWALRHYGRRGHLFINAALAARRGEASEASVEHCLGALRFMEQMIASASTRNR